MKRIVFFVFALAFATMLMAQNSGLGFNYQAVVRNADGLLLANSNVTLRVSLYPGQMASTPAWVETHNVQTDVSGCFGITVGHGQRESSSTAANYSDINFAAVYYWMKIEIDENGTYREVSYAQLPSAPYSEVAHNAAATPAGNIAPFAGTAENIPEGWLLCDGRELSRSEYQKLYDAIGVAWGTGDGSTTFNIPDLRGMFLRGVSYTETSIDPDMNSRTSNIHGGNSGNNVGSCQGDAIRNITGAFGTAQRWNWAQDPTGAFYKAQDSSGQTYEHNKLYDGNNVNYFDASRVVPVGSDNRPKNVYVTYIIKY